MNTHICLIYDRFKFCTCREFIDNLILNFKNKNQVLFGNNKNVTRDTFCNNIPFLRLLDLNFCEECTNYADYVGYCINHIDKYKIQTTQYTFINSISKYNKEEIEYINSYLYELNNYYNKNILKLKLTIKKYKEIMLPLYDFSNQTTDNKQYINNKYNIDYYSLNTIFKNKFIVDIIPYFNNTNMRNIDLINLIVFLLKKYSYQKYILDTIKYKRLISTTFISNSELLYNHIFNSNIMFYTEFIETEKNISVDNHTLRFDIFMIVRFGLKYLTLVIETDEQHHYNKSNNKYDILKDKYCIENGISLLRLHIDKKINDGQINFAFFFIKYLIKYGHPIYYFSDRYINNHIELIKIDTTQVKNIEELITFGSNTKLDKINKIIKNLDNISDIKNLDHIIKNNGLNLLINKYTHANDCEDEDENIKNHLELCENLGFSTESIIINFELNKNDNIC